MKKIFLAALLLLMFSAGTAGAATLSAQSYLVLDISSHAVLAQKNASKAYPIASITKLMNAVVTLENIDVGRNITLTKSMLKPEGASPSLFLGLNVSAKNLFRAMLIQSVNDAAESLADVVGNKKFVALMNKKAKELGMVNTYYYDAHGLNPKNHSTVSDLAKLLAYIYKNHPEILTTTKENGFQLPDASGRLLTFKNLNVFSENPDFIGGKSGYLPEAKQSFASIFNINSKPVAVVVLKSQNRQTDTAALLDQARRNGDVIQSGASDHR